MSGNEENEKKYNYHDVEEVHHRRKGNPNTEKTESRLKWRLEKKAKKEKRKNVMHGILIGALVVIIIGGIVGTGVGIGMYTAVSTEISDMNISDLALNYSSYIYAIQDGKEVTVEQIKSSVNRQWVDSKEIGDNLKNATVAIEDQRFYSHGGVDIKRTVGATFKYMLSKIGIGDASYGGSTITQQVIKNITNERDKSSTRKIKEIMRAIALEKQLSKDEILTMYLNIVYFANNCYGVEAASNMYFNKDAKSLNLQEAAAIAGITQTPAKFDPYVHPENTIEKRNTVLAKMKELSMITDEEYTTASNSSLKVTDKKKNVNNDISSYFVDQVVNDVVADLQTIKGYSRDFAEQQVTNGGLKIYATIDPKIQKIVENVYTNTSNFPNAKVQSAMVIVDPHTGEIKAMVGGVGKKTEIRGLNRATQARRQPGSSIKPLSVYAPALDLEKIDESLIIKDEQITIGNDNWKPTNSYSGFKGNMNVKEAVGRSSNIPAVKVLDMIGLNSSFKYLKSNFKLDSIVDDDKNYSSLALGGLTKGVSVEEMAGAYAAFANEGKYNKPYTYTKVLDASGNTVLENKTYQTQALKPATAYIMSDLLLEPINSSYGTARAAKLSDMTAYGKTGTTNDNYDKWFVGYTSYYVGAVWYGFDTPKSIGASHNPATAVWKKVMEEIHKGLEDKPIKKPNNVVEVEICLDTGMLAKKSCDSTTAYFLEGTQPKKTCTGSYSNSSTDKKYTSSPSKTKEPSNTNVPGKTDSPKNPQSVQTQAPIQTEIPTKEELESDPEDIPDDGGAE